MSDSIPPTSRSGEPVSAVPSTTRPFVFVLGDTLEHLELWQMPPTERSVLKEIAVFADHSGRNAYPRMKRISKRTGFALATIAKAVDALTERHWLIREHRYDADGARTSNLYTIRLDGEPWGEEQAARRRRAPPVRKRPLPSRDEKGAPPAGDRTPHRPVKDPSPSGERPLPHPTDGPPLAARNRSLLDPSLIPPVIPTFDPSVGARARTEDHNDRDPLILEPSPGPSRRKSPRSIPDDWRPEQKHFELGSELRFDCERVLSEADRFRDDALAKDTKWVKWDSAFSNWLRNARKFQDRDEARGIRRPVDPEDHDPSADWPEAKLVPLPPPRDPPPRPEPTPEVAAYMKQYEGMTKAQLDAEAAKIMGCHGWGSGAGR